MLKLTSTVGASGSPEVLRLWWVMIVSLSDMKEVSASSYPSTVSAAAAAAAAEDSVAHCCTCFSFVELLWEGDDFDILVSKSYEYGICFLDTRLISLSA